MTDRKYHGKEIKTGSRITLMVVALIVLLMVVMAVSQNMEVDAPPGTSEDDAVPDVVIDVYGEGLIKTNLAVPPFVPGGRLKDGGTLGRQGSMIIGQDLQFSSYFNVKTAPDLPALPEGGFTEETFDFMPYEQIVELVVVGTYQLESDGTYTFDLKLFDAVQKAMLTRAIYHGDKRIFRRLMHRFADEVLNALTGTPGPFESRIAFVGDSAGHREIFICDTDGHNMVKLTHNDTINLSPAWSPDASKLVYTSYILKNPDIFILPVTGGRPKKIFGGRGLNYGADWSKSSGRIAFASSNNKNEDQEIYTIKPDGKDLVQVTHDPWSIDVSPSWSPDGKFIAFVSSRYGDKPQVLVVPAGGGTAARVSRSGGYNTDPSWGTGPLGDYILYCGRAGGGLDILGVRLGAGQSVLETVAIVNRPGADEAPSISPDGRFVVYTHGFANNYDIYMSSLREQKPRKITRLPGKESAPAWSPRITPK